MKKSIFFIVIICAFLFPIISFAGNLKGPLVPCGRCCEKFDVGGECIKPCKDVSSEAAQPCTLCHIFVMLQTIIDFITLGIFIFAPIFIAAGGIWILISADTPDRLNLGKSMIKNAIIGLVIALLAWTMINELLIVLAGSTTVEGKKTGTIFKWPWNDIKCEGGGVGDGEETVSEGQYCVCKTPRYAYIPGDDLSTVPVIGEDIKVTGLASYAECSQKCVMGNFKDYCYNSVLDLPSGKYNLDCVDQSSVTTTQGCGMRLAQEYGGQGCPIGSKCYRTDDDCMNAALTTYVKKCFLDGQALCDYHGKGGSTYCPTAGSKAVNCEGGSNFYVLYRWQKEEASTTRNALECSKYSTGEYYCRLNCQYEKCHSDETGTPSGDWRFQGNLSDTKNKQIADATPALTNFLNCFYQKAPSDIGYISAITDKDIYNGTCDPKICKTSSCTDECGEDKACDHGCRSCHYGGTCPSTKSYAVDFGDEENVCVIATAAKQCNGVSKIYGPQTCGGKVEDDNQHEDHVHVGVTNSCGCN